MLTSWGRPAQGALTSSEIGSWVWHQSPVSIRFAEHPKPKPARFHLSFDSLHPLLLQVLRGDTGPHGRPFPLPHRQARLSPFFPLVFDTLVLTHPLPHPHPSSLGQRQFPTWDLELEPRLLPSQPNCRQSLLRVSFRGCRWRRCTTPSRLTSPTDDSPPIVTALLRRGPKLHIPVDRRERRCRALTFNLSLIGPDTDRVRSCAAGKHLDCSVCDIKFGFYSRRRTVQPRICPTTSLRQAGRCGGTESPTASRVQEPG